MKISKLKQGIYIYTGPSVDTKAGGKPKTSKKYYVMIDLMNLAFT